MCKYKSVLLIDDSDLDNFVCEQTLKAHLFSKNIHIRKDVVSALEFLNNPSEISQHEFPDVIFIDINMPVTNGFEFITILKNNPPPLFNEHKPKLVILTSSIYKTDEMEAKQSFNNITYIVKPLTKQSLDLL